MSDIATRTMMNMINAKTRRVKFKRLHATHGKALIFMEVETLDSYYSEELEFSSVTDAFNYLTYIHNFIRYESD